MPSFTHRFRAAVARATLARAALVVVNLAPAALVLGGLLSPSGGVPSSGTGAAGPAITDVRGAPGPGPGARPTLVAETVRPVEPAAVAGACGWRPPVVAPVTDPFRLPDGPFAAGNRGVEYGTGADQPVLAVAGGRVELAGLVVGLRWVVVAHDHGLRSTYGPLATSTVAVGQAVAPGQVLGTTSGRLLLTARLGDRYVDPAPLLAGRCGRLRLVPPPPPPP